MSSHPLANKALPPLPTETPEPTPLYRSHSTASTSSTSSSSSSSSGESTWVDDEPPPPISHDPPNFEYAVAATAGTEDDGRVGIVIDVPQGSRYFTDRSALGIPRSIPETDLKDVKNPKDLKDDKSVYDGKPEGSAYAESSRKKAGSEYGGEAVPSKNESLAEGSSRKAGSVYGGEAIVRKKEKRKGKFQYRRMKEREEAFLPPMSIVIFIVGSRGDVQPYIALALALIIHAGHRVRLATHPDFQDFVLSANSRLRGKTHKGVDLEGRLEFFDAGGNPKELMAYMVKNPGLLPGFSSLTNGDIGRKRDMAAEYLRGFYRSTFSPDPVSGKEFAADAIISNPPAFAHIHIAEALGLPLLMSFTMPWTATTAFPHPLVNVKKSNADQWATNWMGYHLTDILMWEGLGSVINDFRTSILRLRTIPERTAPGVLDHLKVPWTYCWSPELLPKPKDWSTHIDISGFYFLDGEDDFVPPEDLAAFLARGPAPVYIGFGSVVISDPEGTTDKIFQAVEAAGVRAVLSAGWAGLGKGREESNPNIFILTKDCSHEWLFADNRVAAVCHHGGAGTTACGLRHGRPSIVVPFFGDQKFWGDAVHNAGAGPTPIPFKHLSADNLTAALRTAISPEIVAGAGVLGEKIRTEKGETRGVKSFTRNMPFNELSCDVDPRQVAVWSCPKFALKLSVNAAAALISAEKISFSDLEPYRSKEYDSTYRRDGPIASTGVRIANILATTVNATTQLYHSPVQGAIGVVCGIPEAAVGVVAGLFDGFDTLSLQMGSTPRIRGEIRGIGTGLKEGGKAVTLGFWDGITGLLTEPIDGAMREGFAGFGKGMGRGVANLFVRPLTGMLGLVVLPSLGLVVLPSRGVRASVRKVFASDLDPHAVLRGPRTALTKTAMERLSLEERDRTLHTFSLLEKETKKRKRRMKRTQFMLFANKKERAAQKVERQRARFDRRERKEVERKLKEREGVAKEEKKKAKKAAEEERGEMKARRKEENRERKAANGK